MRELALDDLDSPEVRILACSLPDPLTLDYYLRLHWRYRPDPDFAEYVEGPSFQIANAAKNGFFQGDCDDAATLAGAIMTAQGWPCRFVAYRLSGRVEFSHVNLRCTGIDGSSFDVDPTVLPDRLPVRSEEEMEVWL